MGEEKVLVIGKATIDNIKRGVSVLKKSLKEGKNTVPTVLVFKVSGEADLYVGLYGRTGNKQAVNVLDSDKVITFTDEGYRVIAQKTENVSEIAKIIQKNALDKVGKTEKPTYSTTNQEYDDLLLNIGDFLENENSLNIVYSQGVESFNAFDYIHMEDMVDEVRGKLVGGKTLKGVQIKGIPKVQIYIKVTNYNDTTVSLTYFGNKDNVYKTFKWDGKESLKTLIQSILSEAKEYDTTLTSSRLNKDVGSVD